MMFLCFGARLLSGWCHYDGILLSRLGWYCHTRITENWNFYIKQHLNISNFYDKDNKPWDKEVKLY